MTDLARDVLCKEIRNYLDKKKSDTYFGVNYNSPLTTKEIKFKLKQKCQQ